MTLIIFIIILGVLVLVHEMGHFLVAKWAKVHVEEFGFGYPPRAFSIGRKWGTLFSINWIPFGGFVKIFGENYEEDEKLEENPSQKVLGSSRSDAKRFTDVNKKWQAAILVAGVTFNILFAWLLFSVGFMIGIPAPIENSFGVDVQNPVLTIVDLVQNSPAEEAGLKTGDKIRGITNLEGKLTADLKPESVSKFIGMSVEPVLLEVDRGGKILNFEVTPKGIGDEEKKIIGVQMDMIGTIYLPIHRAFIEGARVTFDITYLTVEGIFKLIKDAVFAKADLSAVTGPVGIVGLVGDASRLGFSYLLTFTALISINLAVVNLIPFPALDGGRLLFVAVEAVTKRPINARFAVIANTIGFFLLIGMMLIVTYRDVLKLF